LYFPWFWCGIIGLRFDLVPAGAAAERLQVCASKEVAR